MALMIRDVPNLNLPGAGNPSQNYPRWRYEAVEEDGILTFETNDEIVDGYRRIDNISDEALRRFREAFGDQITKDDIFYYVYGLLHSPEYRDTLSRLT